MKCDSRIEFVLRAVGRILLYVFLSVLGFFIGLTVGGPM